MNPVCPLHRREMVAVPMPAPSFVHVVCNVESAKKWRRGRKVLKCPLDDCTQYGPAEAEPMPMLVSEYRAKGRNGWLSEIAKGWE